MCDCIEKMKEEFEEKGLYQFTFDNTFGTTKVLLPFRYRVKNDKTGELTKKVWHGRYIPKYCPFCGEKLREAD